VLSETTEYKFASKKYTILLDLTTSGATVIDTLNNVPSVTVDRRCHCARGNENVRILINGKPSAIAGFGSTVPYANFPPDQLIV
jgi:hypothetical protein